MYDVYMYEPHNGWPNGPIARHVASYGTKTEHVYKKNVSSKLGPIIESHIPFCV